MVELSRLKIGGLVGQRVVWRCGSPEGVSEIGVIHGSRKAGEFTADIKLDNVTASFLWEE
jgi:hypothetical protein